MTPSRLVAALADAEVDFVVIGAIAVVAQGHIRTTRDLDITYATDADNLDALGRALVALDARLRGVAEVVPFVPDGRTLRGAEILTLDGHEVLVASLDDLIAMKRAAGRPRDLDDIEALEEIRRIRVAGG